MLTKVRLVNFLSFKEETVVDVTATNYKVLQESNVYDNALKGLFFFGANASGKTNVIKGLKLLLDLLFAEKNIDLNLYKCLFCEDTTIILDYEFQVGGNKIRYEIEYEIIKKVFIEQLSINDNVLLNRVGDTGKTSITDTKVYTDISSDSLLLREIYFNTKFRNNEILQEWYEYLLNSVFIDGYKEIVFSPNKIKLDIDSYFKDAGTNLINSFFEDYKFDQRIEYSKKSRGKFVSISSDEESVFFKREGIGEPIPFHLESLGNQKLIRLLPAFFHVINKGGMLIVDEFSSGLHNFLEELLIKYFNKKSNKAQIFIVSHSTNLLTTTLLRPDQVYAVNFNQNRGSVLKRFSSEQPRVAQNLEKMYTAGVFGGIPDFKTSIDEV